MTTTNPMYWNRFDICEAYNLLAHDWGLYDVKERLNQLHFACSPSAEFYRGLTENGQEIYDTADRAIRDRRSNIKSEYLPLPSPKII